MTEEQRIEKLLSSGRVTSEHLQSVLKSFAAHVKRNGGLSPGQDSWLARMESNHSDKTIARKEEWERQYSDEHKADALIMAHYYLVNPPYFGDLVKDLFETDNLTLSEAQFNKMCRNKYALKVLSETKREPLYPTGTIIQFRTNNKVRQQGQRTLPNTYGVVIQTDARPVTRAAKGAKMYKVLPVGRSAVFAREADIKKAKNVK